eukprot:CAMPEP_0168333734 /NCGR_PEP_ID=MMETSP0213-20121227/9793_1 /TAXON_ID=151035 /ORGANISM="Euplotes harpa, Strain FSP1.4" /LENGTH=179 /DNA_ID=CAMNT_0008338133 /DNA_START=175 /DNA_END=714 /DNA_ORIENTATION=+
MLAAATCSAACTSKNYDTSGRNSSNADNKTTCTFSLADPQKLALSSVVSSAGSSVCNYKFEFNSAVPLTIELADGDFVVTLFDASGKTMGKMDRSLSKCSADTGLLQSVVVNGVSKAVVATGVSQISLTDLQKDILIITAEDNLLLLLLLLQNTRLRHIHRHLHQVKAQVTVASTQVQL